MAAGTGPGSGGPAGAAVGPSPAVLRTRAANRFSEIDVRVGVVSELVPVRDHLRHDLRIFLDLRSQHEKRRPRAGFAQCCQDLRRVLRMRAVIEREGQLVAAGLPLSRPRTGWGRPGAPFILIACRECRGSMARPYSAGTAISAGVQECQLLGRRVGLAAALVRSGSAGSLPELRSAGFQPSHSPARSLLKVRGVSADRRR